MEIRVLNYFLTVVNEGSMNKAAEALHITQPTLSRQIAQLEDELDIKLFDRSTKRLKLTNEGILLKRRAEEILTLVNRTEKELLLQDQNVEGQIVIGGGELSSFFTVAKIIKDFRQKYPQVHFDMITANADETKEQIEKGLVDIGVLLEPIEIEKYDFIRLKSSETWMTMMRADDPLAQKEYIIPEDLIDSPIILPRRKNVHNEIKQWFGPLYYDLDILFTTNLSTNGIIMVSQGLSRAIMTEGVSRLYDHNQIIARPLYPLMTSNCVLVWKKNQPRNIATEKFIEFFNNALKA